jgi:DNA-binding XRE family transcriptional regulator
MRGPKPKPQNEKNKLRQLRELVASPKPMTQSELAEALRISVDSVKSMEVGRLQPSPKLLARIYRKYGVQWDDAREEWTAPTNAWRRGPKPRSKYMRGTVKGGTVKMWNPRATLKHIQAYQEALQLTGEKRPPWDRDAVKWRIDELFDSVPGELWLDLLDQIQDFLDQRRDDLVQHIGESKKLKLLDKKAIRERLQSVFNKTASTLFFMSNAQTGEVYGSRSYPYDLEGQEITNYQVRMRDHYAKATKNVNPDGSRTISF